MVGMVFHSYDWMDAITRKGYYQDYNVNLQARSGSMVIMLV